jgi:hypothetical protein
MKKFLVTEEEKKHIMGLYEKVGDQLTPDMSKSPRAQYTKRFATFLNQYYKINLPSATTGNWKDQDYNDTLKKFMEEKGIQVWVCKKGDGYCREDGADEGEVTAKEIDKLKQAMNPTQTDEKINTTHDNSFDYKLSGGKYYFKAKPNTSYSKKYPNWTEAKGEGLNKIKERVKF